MNQNFDNRTGLPQQNLMGTTTTATSKVIQQIPIVEQVTQAPIIHHVDVVKEIPFVQQQRVVEKADIIENQPCKVGETQTIQVTTTTAPTPIALLQGGLPLNNQPLSGIQTGGIQTTGMGFGQPLERDRVQELETRFEDREYAHLGTGTTFVSNPSMHNQLGQLPGQSVSGDYVVTKENPIPKVAVAQNVQPLGHQPQLVTETIVHPAYDEHGRLTLPKDLPETKVIPPQESIPPTYEEKQKVGFGTKIKNLLHLGKHKNQTDIDTTDSTLTTGQSGLNQNYGLNQPMGPTTGLPTGDLGTTGDYKKKEKLRQDSDGDFKHKIVEKYDAK